jgi:hypothetical protein
MANPEIEFAPEPGVEHQESNLKAAAEKLRMLGRSTPNQSFPDNRGSRY